jgi:hypothetical protein
VPFFPLELDAIVSANVVDIVPDSVEIVPTDIDSAGMTGAGSVGTTGTETTGTDTTGAGSADTTGAGSVVDRDRLESRLLI